MRVHIEIDGMHCAQCVQAVEQVLTHHAGVATCHVQVGLAEVTFDPTRTEKGGIFEAIRGAGAFQVRGFSAPSDE